METNGLYYLELNMTVKNNRIAEVRYPPEALGFCCSPLRPISIKDKGDWIVHVKTQFLESGRDVCYCVHFTRRHVCL
jgi:hypothetical protein